MTGVQTCALPIYGMLYFQEGYTQKTKVMLMDKKDNQGDIENYKGKYTPT